VQLFLFGVSLWCIVADVKIILLATFKGPIMLLNSSFKAQNDTTICPFFDI